MEYRYKVAEIFTSINGEGTRAGELAVFVRLCGCNLRCRYCDTMWANTENAPFTEMTAEEIRREVLSAGVRNVTLTGGEPLIHEHVDSLLKCLLQDSSLSVEIETNGSVYIGDFLGSAYRPVFTLDYKLPSSGMESKMVLDRNVSLLEKCDTVKLVSGSTEDLQRAADVIRKYDLCSRCHVYLSPVFGKIDPADIVEFMKKEGLNGVRLQLQLHKFIWDPMAKGV